MPVSRRRIRISRRFPNPSSPASKSNKATSSPFPATPAYRPGRTCTSSFISTATRSILCRIWATEVQSAAATLAVRPVNRGRSHGRRILRIERERRRDRRVSGDKGATSTPSSRTCRNDGNQSDPCAQSLRAVVASEYGASLVLLAVDDDDRDIVARAALERQMKQVVAGFLRIAGGKQRRDFFVPDVHRQSVAAQEEPIADVDRPVDELEVGLIARAKRAGHDVAARPDCSPPLRRADRGR